MLEIKDLHVQFHTSDHEAVRGIDLTVQDGEIMGLVGESGSGKTVTAMMVSGLLRPEQAADDAPPLRMELEREAWQRLDRPESLWVHVQPQDLLLLK